MTTRSDISVRVAKRMAAQPGDKPCPQCGRMRAMNEKCWWCQAPAVSETKPSGIPGSEPMFQMSTTRTGWQQQTTKQKHGVFDQVFTKRYRQPQTGGYAEAVIIYSPNTAVASAYYDEFDIKGKRNPATQHMDDITIRQTTDAFEVEAAILQHMDTLDTLLG